MSDPNIGRQVDRYEIRSLLGTGGTARVYRAFDQRLQRDVALKLLKSNTLADPDFVKRFEREARTLAGLRHGHIVQIYDYGEQEGVLYIVTQLLPGPTLEQELASLRAQGTTMPVQRALQTLTQIASALDYAHAQGIIHRDIKPGNVIRNHHDDVILTDFGIARSANNQNTSITQVNTVIGTPAYLSPEQAQGLPVSAASDIYALGIVAYELLTGTVPFRNGNPTAVLLDHIQTQPQAPSLLRPGLDPAFDPIILKALAKEPSQRYASAGAFVQALLGVWQQSNKPKVPTVAWHEQQTVVNPAVTPAPAPARPSVSPPPQRPPQAPTTPYQSQTATGYGPRPRSQSNYQGAASQSQARVYKRNPWPFVFGFALLVVFAIALFLFLQRTRSDSAFEPLLPTAALPTAQPTALPTETALPTPEPTEAPTEVPTEVPTEAPPPTAEPTQPPPPPEPTEAPELPTAVIVPIATPEQPPEQTVGPDGYWPQTGEHVATMRRIIEAYLTAQNPSINQETADELYASIDLLEQRLREGQRDPTLAEIDRLWRLIGTDVEQRRIPQDVGKQLRDLLLEIRHAMG
jgi:Serine/threonine protein kinase